MKRRFDAMIVQTKNQTTKMDELVLAASPKIDLALISKYSDD